jgi:hypothetical protein
MGRPLKIKKTTTKDIGFVELGQLESPVYPDTLNTDQFIGVVGGANAIGGSSVATSAYPVVRVQVHLATGGPGSAEAAGFIITQKGATKYLVADTTSVNDEDLVPGRTYIIATVGTTDWQACGASPRGDIGGVLQYAAGDIFTATAVGAGTGTAFEVGICALANEATGALSAGNMNIAIFNGDSTDILVSKLTNKFALDYSTPKVRYLVNFFTDEGTEIKSGTVGQTVALAIAENYTS